MVLRYFSDYQITLTLTNIFCVVEVLLFEKYLVEYLTDFATAKY